MRGIYALTRATGGGLGIYIARAFEKITGSKIKSKHLWTDNIGMNSCMSSGLPPHRLVADIFIDILQIGIFLFPYVLGLNISLKFLMDPLIKKATSFLKGIV